MAWRLVFNWDVSSDQVDLAVQQRAWNGVLEVSRPGDDGTIAMTQPAKLPYSLDDDEDELN